MSLIGPLPFCVSLSILPTVLPGIISRINYLPLNPCLRMSFVGNPTQYSSPYPHLLFIEPVSPASEGGFLTTGPPGKSLCLVLSLKLFDWSCLSFWASPGGSVGKESAWNERDLGLIPGLERSPGGGHGNPLQYSCLENLHGQRSLRGYSPWDWKELDTTFD